MLYLLLIHYGMIIYIYIYITKYNDINIYQYYECISKYGCIDTFMYTPYSFSNPFWSQHEPAIICKSCVFQEYWDFEFGDSSYNIWIFELPVAVHHLARIISALVLRLWRNRYWLCAKATKKERERGRQRGRKRESYSRTARGRNIIGKQIQSLKNVRGPHEVTNCLMVHQRGKPCREAPSFMIERTRRTRPSKAIH